MVERPGTVANAKTANVANPHFWLEQSTPTKFRIEEMWNRYANRTRLAAAMVILLVIPLGLLARSQRSRADPNTFTGFLACYAGDTLWPVMFFFMGRFAFPKASRRRIALAVFVLTMTLEFGQLWQPPSLQWLRQQPGIGFVLGNTFLWSDVACLLTGGVLAVLLDGAIERLGTVTK